MYDLRPYAQTGKEMERCSQDIERRDRLLPRSPKAIDIDVAGKADREKMNVQPSTRADGLKLCKQPEMDVIIYGLPATAFPLEVWW